MTSAVTKRTSRSGLRGALVVAAAASAGAGLVHAAATGAHSDTATLVWLLAACAAAQLGWAAAVVLIPTRTILFLGVWLNSAAVATWFLSRTVGLSAIDELARVQPIGTADLIAAALGALAVGATMLAITQPISRRTMPSTWSAMVVVGTVALVVPAMAAGSAQSSLDHLAVEHVHAGGAPHVHGDGTAAAGHTHEHSADATLAASGDGHSHDAEHSHGSSTGATGGSGTGTHNHASNDPGSGAPHSTDHTHAVDPGNPAAPHVHDPSTPADPATPPHDHHPPSTDPNQPADPPHVHPPSTDPTGPIVTINDPRLSAAQQQAASNLLFTTIQAMAPYPDVAAVQAAGYQSIGDQVTGFEHFVNWTYFYDGIELDPQRIESIVIKIEPNGSKTVASAMYILNMGKTLADVPDIAGSLTAWHDHTNLCWVPNGQGGNRLSGTTDATGQCAVGTNVVTPPMLHVWLTPQSCGPFAGIEGLHGTSCAHTHDPNSVTLS